MPLLGKASPVLTEKDLNRLWSKVVKGPGENDCWGWTDVLSKDGYAYLGVDGRKGGKFLVHRLLYELMIGPIPDGKELDHLCRNRWCVRPDHQEPVTRQVHVSRGEATSSLHARQTHCIHGHPFDLFNTGYYRGSRYCRACRRAFDKKRSPRHCRRRRK